tara:strand:- start:676 stop:1707 length:1032 start_codon:yes stop_codon:yes gene_type:complete
MNKHNFSLCSFLSHFFSSYFYFLLFPSPTTTTTATKDDGKDAANNEDEEGDYKMGETTTTKNTQIGFDAVAIASKVLTPCGFKDFYRLDMNGVIPRDALSKLVNTNHKVFVCVYDPQNDYEIMAKPAPGAIARTNFYGGTSTLYIDPACYNKAQHRRNNPRFKMFAKQISESFSMGKGGPCTNTVNYEEDIGGFVKCHGILIPDDDPNGQGACVEMVSTALNLDHCPNVHPRAANGERTAWSHSIGINVNTNSDATGFTQEEKQRRMDILTSSDGKRLDDPSNCVVYIVGTPINQNEQYSEVYYMSRKGLPPHDPYIPFRPPSNPYGSPGSLSIVGRFQKLKS